MSAYVHRAGYVVRAYAGESDVLRSTIPGHALGAMIRQAGQHVGEPSLWIDLVELGGAIKV
ncbi:hypothetical protein I6F09_25050 [Bradyrhizobium sp. IC3195]|uniref:hypothetical protein n=1 Tax=Bradyrhizobium sp. IC3195 TaxID=2793804 RepID=UPI001CD1C92D|nr:hypothetical protein [Bradyrhizobium sp. IC3195]MCA1471141.1 hypothetical protein [Bradyrhizobium sp. IC3195]